jgi:hypothetical protein
MIYFPQGPPSIALESKVDEALLPALNPKNILYPGEDCYDFAPPGLTDRTGFGRSALQHRQSCEPHRAQTSWAQHLYQSAEWLTLWGLNEAADAAVKERSQ